MATGSSMCTFSTAGASRQSVMSFQKRLSSRRSVQALGQGLGGGVGMGLAPRTRGGPSRKQTPKLIVDGVDVSPKPLLDVTTGPVEDRPHATQNAMDLLGGLAALGGSLVHAAPSASSGFQVTRDPSTGTSTGFSTGPSMGAIPGLFMGPSLVQTLNTENALAASSLSVLSDPEERAPSQFVMPQPHSAKGMPPTSPVYLLLSETPTFWLLDLHSRTAPLDSEEGEEVLRRNTFAIEYAHTVHTFSTVDVQTAPVWTRSKETIAPRVKRKNVGVQATVWDLHDVERGVAEPSSQPPRHQHLLQVQAERRAVQRKRRQLRRTVLDRISSQRSLSLSDADTKSVDSKHDDSLLAEERLRAVLSLSSFRRAALLMERVLAARAFHPQQLAYCGLPKADPLSPDLHFDYKLNQLWKLECEWAAGRNVTCLAWNCANSDLLAAGYGKYLQTDQATGLVCMWSTKVCTYNTTKVGFRETLPMNTSNKKYSNPLLPERLYRFCSPVTAMRFSRTRPNLLAVGFQNGGLTLLDVSSTEKSVIADVGDLSESGVASPNWEPIWSIAWMSGQEFNVDDEVLVTGGQNGQVLRWMRGDRGLEWTLMLRVPSAPGDEHGLPGLLGAPGRCSALVRIDLRPHAAVLCLEPVPNDPLRYLVATEDGCVHSCSTNYLHRHVDIMTAHAGPIYRLSFSPFCDKVFLTCGADWAVRLWAVGINEPLVTLTSGMQAVEDAAWSPRNSTIVASISGEEVCMWDLRRKTYVPTSRTSWTWSSPPSTLAFSPSQDDIVVADRDGRVAVFALQDMPFAPYYQTKALAAALQRALATKPAVLIALNKIGDPFG